MLETLDYTILIGSTPTFSYFDLYLYSAYAAHYVYRIEHLDGNFHISMQDLVDYTYVRKEVWARDIDNPGQD